MATGFARSTDAAARAQGGLRGVLPWIGVVAVVTLALVLLRDTLDKANFALAYLLVVLAGSARTGRRGGAALAVLCFFCFNFFLLPPYYTLVLARPLDWLVLAAFLIATLLAAQLLHRAQRETVLAGRRAEEIDRLATLGAETLNAARAEDAVSAVARVLRTMLDIQCCEIYEYDAAARSFRIVGQATTPVTSPATLHAGELLTWVAEQGRAAVQHADGTMHVVRPGEHSDSPFDQPDARSILMPLQVRTRTVGVLRLADSSNLRADDTQRRVIEALGYYGALGVERLRLEREAERAAALGEADRLKEALIAAVSHDLRTPLTTIKALAHEIRRQGDERAATIELEADRLNRMVTDLLDLSRLNAGALPVHAELNAVDDLLGAALERLAGHPRVADITTQLPAEPVFARFDFVQTLRALVNLLENGLKFSAPGSQVEVRVEQQAEALLISVLDRGPGVPADLTERVFEPFAHFSVTPDTGGAGLGLAIARSLARAQGGDVTCQPRPGGGSCFELRLPALHVEDLPPLPAIS